MTAVEKWIEGKPSELAKTAAILAASASSSSEALNYFRDQLEFLTPQPPLVDWLQLYRQHKKIAKHFQKYLLNKNILPSIAPLTFDENIEIDKGTLTSLRDSYRHPEMLFFFKVWAPCWILYRTSPTKLLRQARLGKISAFEKLLRLDNSIIFDPKLSEIFHQLKGKNNKQKYRKLLLAFRKPATEKVTPQRIKTIKSVNCCK